MRGVFDGCIDSLSYIPEDATCAQLRCHYYTGRATSRMWGSKYRNGVMTDLGNPYPKGEQVARCGNAVCPPMAAAVVRANWQEVAVWDISTMAELERRVAV